MAPRPSTAKLNGDRDPRSSQLRAFSIIIYSAEEIDRCCANDARGAARSWKASRVYSHADVELRGGALQGRRRHARRCSRGRGHRLRTRNGPRRVFGPSHPSAVQIEIELQAARAALRLRSPLLPRKPRRRRKRLAQLSGARSAPAPCDARDLRACARRDAVRYGLVTFRRPAMAPAPEGAAARARPFDKRRRVVQSSSTSRAGWSFLRRDQHIGL